MKFDKLHIYKANLCVHCPWGKKTVGLSKIPWCLRISFHIRMENVEIEVGSQLHCEFSNRKRREIKNSFVTEKKFIPQSINSHFYIIFLSTILLRSPRTKNNIQAGQLKHTFNSRNRQARKSKCRRLHVKIDNNIERKRSIDNIIVFQHSQW